VVQDYTPGTQLTASELESFTYTSSLADVSVTQDNLVYLSGGLGNVSNSNFYFYSVFTQGTQTYDFIVYNDAGWCYGLGGTCSDPVCVGGCGGGPIGIDYGTNGAFTLADPASTPEPSSLLLLGSGLMAAAAVRRRLGGRVARESDDGHLIAAFPSCP
jgi:PEP-CTERM motif